MKINVMDLFAGIGGLSYGFSIDNHFEILLANENDKDMAIGYKLNHKDVNVINTDIKDISNDKLQEILENRQIDVIVGGPPCQSYSTLGKRQNDEKANLFKEYCRILSYLKPKVFVFENVVGLLSMNKGNLIKEICNEFEKLGYILKYKVLNVMHYGVPQFRERLIIVGVLGENNYQFPKETHTEYVTLKEAIGDLDIIESGKSSNKYLYEPNNEFLRFVRDTDILTEHSSPKNNEKLIKIMKTLKEGQTKDDLPEEIRPKSGYKNTYSKLWWNKPSTTITRNFACPSSSRCIHPRDSRAMSIREGARLQSFPDSYKFYGSDTKKRLQIGNAVPPLLSIAIKNEILKLFI